MVPQFGVVLLSDTQTPIKALATYEFRADDYVIDMGPPPSISSIAHIHKIQNTFFSPPDFKLSPCSIYNMFSFG